MKLVYGLNESTDLGPMVSMAGKQKVLSIIEKGLKEGAKIVLDARNPTVEGLENGYSLAPTILKGISDEMEIRREESFGPIICLSRVKGLSEALYWINNSNNYGHSACIYTGDGTTARRFKKEADVGNIGINVPVPQPYAFFPLGSKHEPAYGLAKSRIDSLSLFLEQKQ